MGLLPRHRVPETGRLRQAGGVEKRVECGVLARHFLRVSEVRKRLCGFRQALGSTDLPGLHLALVGSVKRDVGRWDCQRRIRAVE